MMTLPQFPRMPFDSCAINVGDQALPLAGVMSGTQISVYSYTPCNTTCFHLHRFLNLLMSTYLSHMFCYYLGSFYPLPLQQCRKNTCQRWNCVWNCSVLTSSGLKWRLEFIPTCTGKKSKVTQMKAGWQIKFFAQCCWRHFPLCTCTLGRSCAGRPPLEIIGETKIKSPNKRNSTEMQTAKVKSMEEDGWVSISLQHCHLQAQTLQLTDFRASLCSRGEN